MPDNKMLVRRCVADIYRLQIHSYEVKTMVSRYSFQKPIMMSQADRVVTMS